jgi:hypothetical protein
MVAEIPGLKRVAISTILWKAHITDARRNVKQPIGIGMNLYGRQKLLGAVLIALGIIAIGLSR